MSWNSYQNLMKHRYIKPIVKELRKMGYKILVIPNSKKIGVKNAYGYHSGSRMEIAVVRRTHKGQVMSVEDIAFVLAHELRHAQHTAQGLYRDYYKFDKLEPEHFLPPNILVAHRAELDCDRFAREYVKNNCDKPSRFSYRRYPIRKCRGYTFFEIRRKYGQALAEEYWPYGEAGLKRAGERYRKEGPKFWAYFDSNVEFSRARIIEKRKLWEQIAKEKLLSKMKERLCRKKKVEK